MPTAAGARKSTERYELKMRHANGEVREHRMEEVSAIDRSTRTVFRRYFTREGVEVDSWDQTATPEEIARVRAAGGDPYQKAIQET